MSSNVSKFIFITAQAVLGSALLIGAAGGCADALVYAKDSSKQGMTLYNQGDYPEAAASFQNATRQEPSDYRSYYYAGASYQNMHDYQQAISCYRSCLDVMPMTLLGQSDTPFRYRTIDALATAISKSQTSETETAALEKKCASRAQVEDQWLLAKIYRYMGDADAAVDAYNKAVLIDPDNFTVAKEAGLYEVGLGQTDRAKFALKKANAANPDDEQVNSALRNLGVMAGSGLSNPHDMGLQGSASPSSDIQTPRD